MSISLEQLQAMQAEARADSAGAGTYVILDEEGDFVAGTVTGIFTETASFGDVEEVGLTDARTKHGALDGERRLRLSRVVLARELGSEAENGPVKKGQAIYVEYHGEGVSKKGNTFHRYTVKRFDAVPEAAPAEGPSIEKIKDDIRAQFDAEEIPFD